MTRAITIVNTSNWDGEDYIIRTRQDHIWNEMTLKPGENITLCPEWMDFELRPIDSKEPTPFVFNGEQVFPIVLSYVGQPHDDKRRFAGDFYK